jgi:uncharacterized protein (DUF1800 family)
VPLTLSLTLSLSLALTLPTPAADPYSDPAPPTLTLTVTNPPSAGLQRIQFTAFPAADQFRMLRADEPAGPWAPDLSGIFSNLTWTAPAPSGKAFHRLEVTPLASNALLVATVLNRLAYGPTPDLLDRLAGLGPDAYINEQLAPETVTERATAAHAGIAAIESRLGTPTNYIVTSAQVTTGPGTAGVIDLQAWLVLRAVFADRQLLEVLTQFWENHFVTYAAKSANFFGGAQFRDAYPQRAAAEWEWREVTGWRNAMLRTNGTFHDLLRISAESPAMITYLDTATSRGNPPNIPNENYSREVMELFCMGVDNGYDQTDITNMAPCWTGWTVDLVLPGNAGNPFAPRSTVRLDPAGPNAFTNLLGVWSTVFKPNFHASGAKRIWGGKTVPARFGPPYTTKLYGNNAVPGLYELNIPARTGTNGLQDGYDIVRHIADLPFTQEFISVKLCRLLVHDDFRPGYDYTSPDLSAEGQLVKACLNAWESASPKGQLRPVLKVIFDSALFRGAGANAHKVKTPLEYSVSAIRAIRQSNNGTGLAGTWTATTDGYGLVNSQGGGQRGSGGSALNRMGGLQLFNREEPNGYPEAGGGWVDTGSVAERLRFISSFLKPTGDSAKNDANVLLNNNVSLPGQLLQLRLPSPTDQRDAGKVTDVFLALLFPGEGRASLDEYRSLAIDYLNTNDAGTGASTFANLTPSTAAGSAYDTRLRSLVAMLLSLQRFHEQ